MATAPTNRRFLTLQRRVEGCSACSNLPLGPRPIFQVNPEARILIAGQAPGQKTHDKGRPFDDASGDRLRAWLGLSRDQFYDERLIAILPMAFCYPGTGRSGDLPPPSLCAEKWRVKLLDMLPNIELTLVIGQYALDWHLGERQAGTLTETVKNWRQFWPDILPMPHPSPRNNRWLKKNAWFSDEVLPQLQERVAQIQPSTEV